MPVGLNKLCAELTAAGVPYRGVSVQPDVQRAPINPYNVVLRGNDGIPIGIDWPDEATRTTWLATATSIIQAHDGRPRRRRTLTAILAQLDALNGLTQKPVLWTQLTTGALWDVPGTTNYPATATTVLNATGAGGALLNMQMRAVALYIQDYPLWLVNPSFAPTINIPGDEVIP